jgi:hypothetical protein
VDLFLEFKKASSAIIKEMYVYPCVCPCAYPCAGSQHSCASESQRCHCMLLPPCPPRPPSCTLPDETGTCHTNTPASSSYVVLISSFVILHNHYILRCQVVQLL